MTRLPRALAPGVPLHVIQRGNNRQVAFFTHDDYERYLNSLCIAAERSACAIHAYVLMTNHVHLLVTPASADGVSSLMQSVGRRYVRHVNTTYKRSGTLWEGRFRSALVDSERYLLTCMRYIELNPVRAGMVERPEDYRWSSFACNALGKSDLAITPHIAYQRLGKHANERRTTYRQLFQSVTATEMEDVMAIRIGTEKGTPIGNEMFRARVAELLGRRIEKFGRGGDRRGERFKALSSTLTP